MLTAPPRSLSLRLPLLLVFCLQPGKSLYTTIREFVENSLDAAESIGELPTIEVRVEKLKAAEFNRIRGVEQHTRTDLALYDAPPKQKVPHQRTGMHRCENTDERAKVRGRAETEMLTAGTCICPFVSV